MDTLPVDLSKSFNKQPPEEVWLSIQGENNRFYRMLPIQEFVYRLEQNCKPYLRYTTENKERERFKQYLDDFAERDHSIRVWFTRTFRAPGMATGP
jgi:hypothetical protein